jgi:NAD(P)-dependent dehydrogenase (short-subunit alcohol dehydrogenase family)
VNALGRNLAVELAPRGIRVNVLSPGLIEGTAIESNLSGEQLTGFWEDTLRRIPLHRAGSVRDTADAALFLATCPYTSGQVLEVDGGWTAT